jgi:transcriptional regulator with XRE-family HTH domain
MNSIRQQNAPARHPGVPASPAEGDDARTEGQRLLRTLPHSGVEVAEAVGASKQAVSAWRAGTKTPSPALRTRIERALGIPAAAWERTSLGRAPAAAPSVTRPVRRSGMTTIEDVEQLLEDLARDAATLHRWPPRPAPAPSVYRRRPRTSGEVPPVPAPPPAPRPPREVPRPGASRLHLPASGTGAGAALGAAARLHRCAELGAEATT